MIKAICFDLDGVYFTEDGKKAFHKALVELTGDEDKVIYVLYKSPQMLSFVTGKITEQAFWDFVRDYLNLEFSNQEFRDLWVKGYVVDNNVKATVLKAREQGYKTCICSNNSPARVEALQDKFEFLNDFDVSVFSYEVGDVKPSKEIFQSLIDESGVRPEEILYADDNVERIQGAIDLGITSFVYENFNQFLSELKKFGMDLN